ncbi:MAG: type II toxin-antitoxin system RelE/ParE family toxin [Hyphomicrobiaceae bacterium]|nr:type II toxin-antitoxin system RelE/ParE family toxin [Hyphomicrobiaceae bacterium]
MVQIRWTQEAEKWLREIHDYIGRDNPLAAGNVVSGIFEKVERLQQFPEIGHRYELAEEGDIRVLYYGHYRIAYLLKNTEQIDILGIFHGAMELERYLPKSDDGMKKDV